MQIQSRKERCGDGSEFIIRSAVLEDASALLDLARSVIAEGHYQITELSEFELTVEQERKWIREMTNSRDGVILVAEARGEVIGMLDFQRERKRRLGHTGFFGMSVGQPWRGRGVGFALLQTLLDWAETHPTIKRRDERIGGKAGKIDAPTERAAPKTSCQLGRGSAPAPSGE